MHGEFFLVGPTAVGKSSIALEVAEELGAEIVNADAFQVYRGLDILTAKPDAAGQRRVRHHLLSAVELTEEMSAVKFRALALAVFDEIRSRGEKAIIVSGSGLYVKALTDGFAQTAPPNAELRRELRSLSDNELTRRIVQLEPRFAAEIDLNNRRRVIRAIEIAEGLAASTETKLAVIPSDSRGIPVRYLKAFTTGSLDFARDDAEKAGGVAGGTAGGVAGGRPGGFVLVRERDDLYARINERVEQMFREDVEAEVAALEKLGPTAEQALGLSEIQQLMAGEISRADCIAKIQQATRRYAKRQLTWFRHQTNFPQLNLTALSHREAISAISEAIARE